jgi:hypothetical protein
LQAINTYRNWIESVFGTGSSGGLPRGGWWNRLSSWRRRVLALLFSRQGRGCYSWAWHDWMRCHHDALGLGQDAAQIHDIVVVAAASLSVA